MFEIYRYKRNRRVPLVFYYIGEKCYYFPHTIAIIII